jgi:hypothetical protein
MTVAIYWKENVLDGLLRVNAFLIYQANTGDGSAFVCAPGNPGTSVEGQFGCVYELEPFPFSDRDSFLFALFPQDATGSTIFYLLIVNVAYILEPLLTVAMQSFVMDVSFLTTALQLLFIVGKYTRLTFCIVVQWFL